MKAPLCRLCNTAHWPKEPHVWPVTEAVTIAESLVMVTPKPAMVTAMVTPDAVMVTVSDAMVTIPRGTRTSEARLAYMRAYLKKRGWPKRDRAEYMRGYRARVL